MEVLTYVSAYVCDEWDPMNRWSTNSGQRIVHLLSNKNLDRSGLEPDSPLCERFVKAVSVCTSRAYQETTLVGASKPICCSTQNGGSDGNFTLVSTWIIILRDF